MTSWLRDIGNSLSLIGPWGIFLAAGLDAVVPLPGVVDTSIVLLAHKGAHHPALYVMAAVLGSVLGTAALYGLGRGSRDVADRALARPEAPVERGWLDRNAFLAVTVAGMLPPPFPFKAVVLPAGVLRLNVAKFVAAVGLARTVRYGLEAYLAAHYGEQALVFMRQNYPAVATVLILLLITSALFIRSRRRRAA